jgi:hypothetical protein
LLDDLDEPSNRRYTHGTNLSPALFQVCIQSLASSTKPLSHCSTCQSSPSLNVQSSVRQSLDVISRSSLRSSTFCPPAGSFGLFQGGDEVGIENERDTKPILIQPLINNLPEELNGELHLSSIDVVHPTKQ